MDILVHFMEKIGEEPCMIHNQDRNKFGIFCAHGDVYHFADELKLSLCNLYTLWFKSAVNAIDNGVGEKLIESINVTIEYVNEAGDVGVGATMSETISVNATIGEVMNEVLNDVFNENVSLNEDLSEKNVAENGKVAHENVEGQDEVFVNDENETFNGPLNVNGSLDNEYDPLSYE
ncbi:hypothetical protein JHK87_043101 [Glycine soja]|nr:hypothetical protein JHK87_043101 [Glycine soja]